MTQKTLMILFPFVGAVLAIGVLLRSLTAPQQFISPFGTPQASDSSTKQSEKIVYGFLPFWQVSTVKLQPELTHLAYFSLTFDGTGKILTIDDGTTDPGYRMYQSEQLKQLSQQAKQQGAKVDLVVTQLNNDDIEAFLASPSAQFRFQKELDTFLRSRAFDGLNLDVEYQGPASEELRQNFTSFCTELDSFLATTHPGLEISIDVYASSIAGRSIWNIAELNTCVDHFIIMGYDFHKAGSPNAGPVAPLISEGEFESEKSILTYLGDYLEVVPSQKIILGVPFYGYEWQTVSDQPRAHTFPRTGATARYERIQQIIADPELLVSPFWEHSTLSPYLTFKVDDRQKIIYYEDERSLSYKLDLVQDSNLGGIAIWALGYEGAYRNLWDVIAEKL